MIGFKYTVWCSACVENNWDAHHGGKIRQSKDTYATREEAEAAAKEVVGLVDEWKYEVFEVAVPDPVVQEPPVMIPPPEGDDHARSGCAGKVSYESFAAANENLNRVRKRRNFRGSGLRVYRCAHCGKYHVGNSLSLA